MAFACLKRPTYPSIIVPSSNGDQPMVFSEARWREALSARRVEWHEHAVRRMIRRQITREDVLRVLLAADAIEEYAQDQPFPSCLFLGDTDVGAVHVVAAFDDESGVIHVVTAYRPDEAHFVEGFRRRRDGPQ